MMLLVCVFTLEDLLRSTVIRYHRAQKMPWGRYQMKNSLLENQGNGLMKLKSITDCDRYVGGRAFLKGLKNGLGIGTFCNVSWVISKKRWWGSYRQQSSIQWVKAPDFPVKLDFEVRVEWWLVEFTWWVYQALSREEGGGSPSRKGRAGSALSKTWKSSCWPNNATEKTEWLTEELLL